MEPVAHPDLVALGRVLRARMDRTLDAEMEAARAAARRRRTLRDRLLQAEDAGEQVTLSTSDGAVHTGRVTAVGVDHVELAAGEACCLVSLAHIASVEGRR